ncbi:CD2-binding protein-like protein [Trema orientale]|uniref:CD2-binding protein-like protein n=1 Tax=Trema orientale TaxID=63057 RepID=A0A2P5E8M5_TREOI|nr:CD2-binding protein-like protein [Trema orientale]
MAANSSRPNLKRAFSEDDDDGSGKPPMKKRVRFPKGKKVKAGDEAKVKRVVIEEDDDDPSLFTGTDPRSAAKERATRRTQMTTELFSEDNSRAEVAYEENENFVEDGIQIEPFNLDKEREEGYFDAEGNFVEYVNENEIKDAWLDSVEVAQKYTGKLPEVTRNEADIQELTSHEIGKIKRRMADALEPGETVLQALRRLKGTSNNKKDKMSSETKAIFDQLTEDAMKLMENGEYDVYHEKKEVFEREAEGYENLARLRGEGPAERSGQGYFDSNSGKDILSGLTDTGIGSSGSVNPSVDSFDMFAEDDEKAAAKSSSDAVDQPLSNAANINSESLTLESDYVYDESSGYYYSSSLGYYYDPSTGLYCSASSGQWYSFNEETGTYDEVQSAASTV